MKHLIVNADDFGASPGTNRGILETHRAGITTSTSLLVETPWSADAARLARSAPSLCVGLHLNLDGVAEVDVPAALQRQLLRFETLLGAAPTHVDTHHDTHRHPEILTHVREFARRLDLPLRGHSAARLCSSYYGQWAGQSHPEQISVAGLERLLVREVGEGVTELSCHPGYVDPELRSTYAVEREIEVQTLCDPAVPAIVAALGIRLIGFRDLPRHAAAAPA